MHRFAPASPCVRNPSPPRSTSCPLPAGSLSPSSSASHCGSWASTTAWSRCGQRVSQAFADIDVQLKQRQDLIPNLVETVKGYAAHERGTLEAVIRRAPRPSAPRVQDAEVAGRERAHRRAAASCSPLAEAYPDLKANTNFMQLQTELTDIENKLAAARRFFNNAVQRVQRPHPALPGGAGRRRRSASRRARSSTLGRGAQDASSRPRR